MSAQTMQSARVALVNPAHWHFDFYKPGIDASRGQIVGFTEDNQGRRAALANSLAAPCLPDIEALVTSTHPDFVFAFGEHAKLSSISSKLVELGVPFSIEKPGALTASEVGHVARLAENAGVFVSVPFHYRMSDFWRSVEDLDVRKRGEIRSLRIEVSARSPEQHADGSPWLSRLDGAGGGAAINLGHHPIDFALAFLGHEIAEIDAWTSNSGLGLEVEDEAEFQIAFSSGAVAKIRTSYNHPGSAGTYMGFGFALEHERFSVELRDENLFVTPRSGLPTMACPARFIFKKHFADYANNTLIRALTGGPPIAGLRDLENTMKIIDAVYAAASNGSPQKVASFSRVAP